MGGGQKTWKNCLLDYINVYFDTVSVFHSSEDSLQLVWCQEEQPSLVEVRGKPYTISSGDKANVNHVCLSLHNYAILYSYSNNIYK